MKNSDQHKWIPIMRIVNLQLGMKISSDLGAFWNFFYHHLKIHVDNFGHYKKAKFV